MKKDFRVSGGLALAELAGGAGAAWEAQLNASRHKLKIAMRWSGLRMVTIASKRGVWGRGIVLKEDEKSGT